MVHVDFREINRLVVFASRLGADEHWLDANTLVVACKTGPVRGAGRYDYALVLQAAIDLGFIQTEGERIRFTARGEEFLHANPNCFYNILPPQKLAILDGLLNIEDIASSIRSLVSLFTYIPDEGVFLWSPRRGSFRDSEKTVIAALAKLDLVYPASGGGWTLSPELAAVRRLVASEAISLADLMDMLADRAARGEEAERAVLEFERSRLKELGDPLRSRLVVQISPHDVSAGYDIASFTDATPEHDRFIEVKAVKRSAPRIFWTRNEIQVARSERENYWIYLVDSNAKRTTIVMLQCPAILVSAKSLARVPWPMGSARAEQWQIDLSALLAPVYQESGKEDYWHSIDNFRYTVLANWPGM